MSSIATDVRQALNLIVRHPGFAAMTIVMIALGIAGNAAVFRVFDGLFLRPLPFDSPGRLMDLDETAPDWDLDYTGVAYPDYVEWRRSNETFDDLAVFSVQGVYTSTGEETTRSNMVQSSHTLADVLRLRPVAGRFFSADEDVPNGPRVALVSDTYWHGRLGGRADVVGSTLRVHGDTYEVIGVFPDVVKRIAYADIWTPLGLDPEAAGSWYLRGIGRLLPGTSPEQASADLTNVHKAAIERHPVNAITSPVVQPMTERYVGQLKLGSTALLAATGLLLLIACANIAALMLARSLDRGREYGIKMAIGATRLRLARQLVIECLMLGTIGGSLGMLLGYTASEMIVTRLAEQFPAFVVFDLDVRFMVFIVLATLAATAAFALLPALSATGTSPNRELGASSTRATDSRSRLRKMNLLVAGEVALALVLLVAGGVLIRDLDRLLATDPGFDTENLLTYGFDMPPAYFETSADRAAFVSRYLERVRALPGVVNATVATSTPLSGHWGDGFRAEGQGPLGPGESNPIVLKRVVADDYFETMRVRFVSGRPFGPADYDESTTSIIINEAFARALFPGVDDPVGRRVRTGVGETPWLTVVGVTEDVRHYAIDEAMRPGVYQPMVGYPMYGARVAVRTSVTPESLIPVLEDALRQANSELALNDVQTMERRYGQALWVRRASSWLAVTFSAVALILAVGGIYGVVSHGIRRREGELCIRMALGASNGRVVRQVLKQGMLVVGAGIAIGLVLTLGVSRVISSLIVTVTPTDPVVYVSVTLVLALAAAAAGLVPALRLAKLEPAGALRAE